MRCHIFYLNIVMYVSPSPYTQFQGTYD
jgi:hypothetical protein